MLNCGFLFNKDELSMKQRDKQTGRKTYRQKDKERPKDPKESKKTYKQISDKRDEKGKI